MFGRLKDYIIYVAATCSLVFSSFLDNSTAYVSITNNTPYINGNADLDYIKSELNKLKNKKIDIPDVDLSGLENAIDNINKNVNAMKGSLESFEDRLIKVEKRGGGRF